MKLHKFQGKSCFGVLGSAEAQSVHVGRWPRAHGEHIPQDATNAGRCALERLDERRVIMAFHLKDSGKAVAYVDDASVFTRATDHPGRFCG